MLDNRVGFSPGRIAAPRSLSIMVRQCVPRRDAARAGACRRRPAAAGGKVIGSACTPVSEMEYAPFLQRAMEAKPDAVFSFDPGGDVAVAFMKEAKKRGLQEAGIKLLVTGDLVEDDNLPLFGDAMKDVVSAHALMKAFKGATVDSPRGKFTIDPDTREIIELSVEENLRVAARPGRMDLQAVYGLFPRLRERRRNPGDKLSGGEQQMLAIGRNAPALGH